jgi:nucleotide-binding universal stress UspA family protein
MSRSPESLIRTLLVHVQSDEAGLRRLAAAAALARTLNARLIGLGAQAAPTLAPDPYGFLEAPYAQAMEEALGKALAADRAAFQEAAQGLAAEWIQAEAFPTESMAMLAFAADMIVAGGGGGGDRYRWSDTGELVLTAGRPVLIAPPLDTELTADAAVVAWRDTRESRRALADAVPLLRLAGQVRVVEVADPADVDDVAIRLQAVCGWLARHGIAAEAVPLSERKGKVAEQIDTAAGEIGADLIVVGGYGHSRLGEWVFGGVTRDLLRGSKRFLLMSH